jgi:3',5'-cyclic AMP phosphodiesterase CpdA
MAVLGNNRRFAHAAHAQGRVHQLSTSVDHTPWKADSHFEDFPTAPGAPPYHMDLGEILHQSEMDQINQAKKLVFHTTGDTANFKNDFQLQVADLLQSDAETSNAKFLYHLGDVIYDYGEDREYPDQFYEIYKAYHLPIVAIPGNHDGSEFSGGPDSLVGFMTNFCDSRPRLPPSLRALGVDFGRDTMTQLNCYWTLNTPFFTIIGLYTNVPSGGVVKEPQVSWFNNEMKNADKTKPLIVAMHHPIHSVAKNVSHKGSQEMGKLLTDACNFSQRVPELVLAGHVHNYQRFETKINGKKCTFVVAGCGGHAKDPLDMEVTSDTPAPNDPGVTVNFATTKYVGFLRMTATPGKIIGEYIAVNKDQPVDHFQV